MQVRTRISNLLRMMEESNDDDYDIGVEDANNHSEIECVSQDAYNWSDNEDIIM